MIVPDFKRGGDWVRSFRDCGVKKITISGVRYGNIKSRCMECGAEQSRRPRYIGCVNGFTGFQEFVEWHRAQVGYISTDFQIDKDILFKGNLIYSPETCVLVPRQLNMLVVSEKGKRGEFPLGVTYDKTRKMFVAKMSVCRKTAVIGCSYTTPEEAFVAYKHAKENYIKQ